MGTSNPISARKTRQAVGKTIEQVNEQRSVLVQVVPRVNQHNAILTRPFLGRLRWLVLGK